MTEALLIGLIAGMGGMLLSGMIAGSWIAIGLALAFFAALVGLWSEEKEERMITDKALPTPYPHYTNPDFREPKTVFMAPNHRLKDGYVKGAEYNYSDRLESWYGYDKYSQASQVARESGFNRWSAGWAEVYLRTLLVDPNLELVHMLAGYNVSNGFGYWVYGYIKGKAANG